MILATMILEIQSVNSSRQMIVRAQHVRQLLAIPVRIERAEDLVILVVFVQSIHKARSLRRFNDSLIVSGLMSVSKQLLHQLQRILIEAQRLAGSGKCHSADRHIHTNPIVPLQFTELQVNLMTRNRVNDASLTNAIGSSLIQLPAFTDHYRRINRKIEVVTHIELDIETP